MGKPKTLSILDVDRYGNDAKVKTYGIDVMYAEFQTILDEYNRITADMYDDLVWMETNEPRHRFGSSDSIEFVDIELQYGRPDAQAVAFSEYEIGLPLRKGGTGTQWTERYLQLETVERMNIQLNAVLLADSKWLRKHVGAALFRPESYTYKDKYVDNLPLSVVSLLNGDGKPIPLGPEATEFNPATQNHYHVYVTLNDAAVNTIETELLEHVETGRVVHYVNKASEAAVRALSGFAKADDPRIIQSLLTDRLTQEFQTRYTNNTTSTNNDRFIGIVEGKGEFWVKPWIPAGYGFSFLMDSPLMPPLVRRRDPIEPSDLQVVEPDDTHPKLRARTVERVVGFGVVERRNGVAWKIDAANGAYTPPSIYTL